MFERFLRGKQPLDPAAVAEASDQGMSGFELPEDEGTREEGVNREDNELSEEQDPTLGA